MFTFRIVAMEPLEPLEAHFSRDPYALQQFEIYSEYIKVVINLGSNKCVQFIATINQLSVQIIITSNHIN